MQRYCIVRAPASLIFFFFFFPEIDCLRYYHFSRDL